jgi:hypothetical protein
MVKCALLYRDVGGRLGHVANLCSSRHSFGGKTFTRSAVGLRKLLLANHGNTKMKKRSVAAATDAKCLHQETRPEVMGSSEH